MDGSLPAERAERVQALFNAAIELDDATRTAYLREACADDAELHREVESLLTAFDGRAGDVRQFLGGLPLAVPDASSNADVQPLGKWSGRQIDQYEVGDKLGGGGMGVVYEAYDTRLERAVALKFLPPHLSADAKAQARFIHEAKTASALDHPNICTIYDVGRTSEGQLYIVMAYYAGATLKKKIEDGPLPIHGALDYAIQIARGLDKAHGAGIVHRDIKPANVLVTGDGIVKILDFGIAKATGVDLTKTGRTPGTVSYMSPEHVYGRSVDHRADLWALGVVLYEMLTGTRPFEGDHEQTVVYAILNHEPESVSVRRSHLPPALEGIIARALTKDPRERYQNASELIRDLRPIARALETGAPLPPPRRMRQWSHAPRYVAAFALVALLSVAGRYLVAPMLSGPVMESIAVLPLESTSANEAYFVAGMHDELTSALAQVGALRVISRTSTRQYAGSEKTVRAIADELDVDGVVEGTVRRDGDRVRIQVRLIQAQPEERNLWSQSFERELRDVPTLHKEVAQTIAREVEVSLSPEVAARFAAAQPVDPATYEAYLRGMHYLNGSTPEEFQRGLEYMQEAVELDPADARAYAGLGLAYVTLGHGPAPPPDAWQRARAAAERSIRLDSTLADGWAVLADVKTYFEWDWEGAERAFKKSNALNPNLPMNHYHYAWYLALMGRLDEAIAEHERARALDPLTPLHTVWLPGIYLYTGQYERALAGARNVAQEYPDHATALFVLGTSAAQIGAYDEAITAHERMVTINPTWRFALGRTYALAGRTDDAQRIADELEAEPPSSWGAIGLADLHTALGNRDRAFEWLAYTPSHAWLPWSRVNPAVKPLHDDPRFDELLTRLRLPR